MLHTAKINVDWNPEIFREVDEAKKKYLQARSEGRTILNPETNEPLERFRPNLGGFIIGEVPTADGQIAMHIFDETGDRRVIWNMHNPKEIAEAESMFRKYAEKGWKAYAVNQDGKTGRRIYGFDPSTEEVLFDEKTTREKLKDFASKFREVKVVPRTFPG